MSITWGLAMTDAERKTMGENARFEMECYTQAKLELIDLVADPITWLRKVAERAQEIKQEKLSGKA
jgi:hypothetical protein